MGLRTKMALVSDFLLTDCVTELALARGIIQHCTNKVHKSKASKLNAKLFVFQFARLQAQSHLFQAIFVKSSKQSDTLNIAFFCLEGTRISFVQPYIFLDIC